MIAKQIENLAGAPPDPVSMRKLFLLLTRLNFSDPKHYGAYESLLENLVYSDNPTESRLSVDLLSIYAPSKTFSRPAIFVGFTESRFERMAPADDAGHSEDNSRIYKAKRVSTTLKIVHTANDPDQALALGTISATFFLGIQQLLLQGFGLLHFTIESITDATLIEKSPDTAFSCTLTASVNYEFQTVTALESHRIKKFALTLDAQL